jgi:hypothetical protein
MPKLDHHPAQEGLLAKQSWKTGDEVSFLPSSAQQDQDAANASGAHFAEGDLRLPLVLDIEARSLRRGQLQPQSTMNAYRTKLGNRKWETIDITGYCENIAV